MSERLTVDSFIVRIYRADTENRRKFTGMVEAMDGSGSREPFTDLDELGAILNRHTGKPQKKRGKTGPDNL